MDKYLVGLFPDETGYPGVVCAWMVSFAEQETGHDFVFVGYARSHGLAFLFGSCVSHGDALVHFVMVVSFNVLHVVENLPYLA